MMIIRGVMLGLLIIFSGFARNNRKFEVTFILNNPDGFAPSDQMAIWLARPDSSFVKTLFLSEYLSYGGYNIEGLCGNWSSRIAWRDATAEEFDAVTGATPSSGEVKLKLECPARLVPPGEYLIFIEVHLVDEFNELYSGRLDLTGRKASCSLEVSYIPAKCPKMATGDILSSVAVTAK